MQFGMYQEVMHACTMLVWHVQAYVLPWVGTGSAKCCWLAVEGAWPCTGVEGQSQSMRFVLLLAV